MKANNIRTQTFSLTTCQFTDLTVHLILEHEGIIYLTFSRQNRDQAWQWLHKNAPKALFSSLSSSANCDRLQEFFEGRYLFPFPEHSPFITAGTPFQQKVWRLIAKIPYGETRTYGNLARDLNQPRAARAVGRACNANPMALIIPCHRVVGQTGPGGFAGGSELKKRLLELEKKGGYKVENKRIQD